MYKTLKQLIIWSCVIHVMLSEYYFIIFLVFHTHPVQIFLPSLQVHHDPWVFGTQLSSEINETQCGNLYKNYQWLVLQTLKGWQTDERYPVV